MQFRFYSIALLMLFMACKTESKLPILGETTVDKNGEIAYYKAPKFSLTSQLNQAVSHTLFEGKIQVVDFFFTSCPSICPQMTSHLKLVQEAFKEEDAVRIISYSIDAKTDTPQQLKAYANSYEIDDDKWTLLTGDSKTIFNLSKDYKVRAFDDSTAETPNLLHDGTFVLIDGKRRIRGYYNGLEVTDTQRLINDIHILLKEPS